MSDDKPPVEPDLAAAMEQLSTELVGDAARKLEYILDALIMRGQLPASFRRVVSKIRADDGVRVRLATFHDKYRVEGPDIDCAARIPLCNARCCSFSVALSAQDVEEKIVPFVVDHPYELPRDENGRCVCMDEGGACTIYEHRPGTCRQYDCSDDRRVWLDFDAMIPAPWKRD